MSVRKTSRRRAARVDRWCAEARPGVATPGTGKLSMVTLPVYLDNHATTRTDPRVVEAMLPFFTEQYGTAASRHHVFGRAAEEALEAARAEVAGLVGADPREIVFTSGATESNNLTLKGVAAAY